MKSRRSTESVLAVRISLAVLQVLAVMVSCALAEEPVQVPPRIYDSAIPPQEPDRIGTRWGWGNGYSVSYHFVRSSTMVPVGSAEYEVQPIVEDGSPFPPGTFQEMREAIDSWADVTDLRFYETDLPDADVYLGHHDDIPGIGQGGSSYGGSQYIVAFARLNSTCVWSIGGEQGTFKIRNVTCHEMGHVLGLDHTFMAGNVMYYTYGVELTKPGPDDIYKVQQSYGPKLARLSGDTEQVSPVCLSIDPASPRQLDSSNADPVSAYELQVAGMGLGEMIDSAGETGRFLDFCSQWIIDTRPDTSEPAYHSNARQDGRYVIVATRAPVATESSALNYEYCLRHTIDENEQLEVLVSGDGLEYDLVRRYSLQTVGGYDPFRMEQESISLAGYAGSPVFVRFVYGLSGSHFTGDRGVWVDNVRFEDVLVSDWGAAPIPVSAEASSTCVTVDESGDYCFRIRALYPGDVTGEYSQPLHVRAETASIDFSGNGSVEHQDLFLFAGKWAVIEGMSGFDSAYDLSGDNAVNGSDCLMLCEEWLQR